MTGRTQWSIVAPLAACLLLAAWLTWMGITAHTSELTVSTFLLLHVLVYTDAVDFAVRRVAHRRRLAARSSGDREAFASVSVDLSETVATVDARTGWARPFAIVASVFNVEDRVDEFAEAYAPYRAHVWLISDGSTDDTVRRFRQGGWRCIDGGINRRKPGALRQLLRALPQTIESVMVVDPDTCIRPPGRGSLVTLERLIRDFQLTGAGAVAPRIMVEPDGFIGRFQAFEYALCCGIGRLSLGDVGVTSGVAIYRRDALERALEEHSLSVYAEDFENAILLLAEGERIYYDGRLAVSTEGAPSWRRWFSQRVGWYCGLIKVYTERWPAIWAVARRTPFAMYNYVAYLGVLSLALHVLRLAGAAVLVLGALCGLCDLAGVAVPVRLSLWHPVGISAALVGYLALGLAALLTAVPSGERRYVAPIVPLYLFYSIAHVAPMTVGFANWISVKAFRRRLYHDHYDSDAIWTRAATGRSQRRSVA